MNEEQLYDEQKRSIDLPNILFQCTFTKQLRLLYKRCGKIDLYGYYIAFPFNLALIRLLLFICIIFSWQPSYFNVVLCFHVQAIWLYLCLVLDLSEYPFLWSNTHVNLRSCYETALISSIKMLDYLSRNVTAVSVAFGIPTFEMTCF